MSDKERRTRNAARTRRLYANNTEYRIRQKSFKLFKAYGITFDQYKERSAAFDNVCHICEKTCPSGRRLAVDHDHCSGLVRGLLCINCNKGIGNFKDDIQLLEKTIEYLKNFKETKIEVENALNKIAQQKSI